MSAITAMKKFQVPKSSLAFMMQHLHHIPQQYHDCLEKYYLLYWDGSFFTSLLVEGTITHHGEIFQVSYKNCTPFQAKRAKQISLSFRTASREFGLPSVVMVTIPFSLQGN